MRAPALAACVAFLLASAGAAGQLKWDVREGNHPVLGAVRFAHLKLPVATTVGSHRVYSNAYVSCEPKSRTMAVELSNQVAPDDPGGLRAAAMSRLVCKKPRAAGIEQSVIATRWEFNGIGDAMARGLAPGSLRSCSSIGIAEEVVLPEGWGERTASVVFEIGPGAKELEEVFAACGEANVAAWRTVRVVAHGKTNVRAQPTLHSPVVAHIDPGDVILAQPTQTEWWRVKSRRGTFQGYVREDRLVVK